MLDEIVAVFATGAGRRRARRHARRRRPQPRRCSTAAPTSSVIGVDRDPRRPRRGDRPPRALRRPLPRRPRPLRRPRPDHARPTRLPDRRGLSGALFDLGVSSPQLDRGRARLLVPPGRPARHAHGPDRAVVGRRRRQRLRRRRADPGHPPLRRRALRRAASPGRSSPPGRSRRPVELAAIVTAAIPAAARRTGGHPATRTFQAIRIEVNAELDALPVALDAAIEATRPGGRIAVLSYHSGEDRIVKDRFRRATGACDCPPDLPCVCGAVQTVRLVRGVPKRPSAAERRRQPPRRVGPPARRRARRRTTTPRSAALTMAATARPRASTRPRPRSPRRVAAADGRRRVDVGVAADPPDLRLVPTAARRRQRGDAARRRRRRADARRRRAAHPARRAAAGDRPPRGSRHRRPRALRRAAPAARRAALADPAGDRGGELGMVAAPQTRVPHRRPADAGRGDRRRRHRRRGDRHRRRPTDPLDQIRRVKAATGGRDRDAST